ncbi:Pre-piRNA 3'-exonuclease trimmer [Frankliniella fusca]|uniref:Pre-piRNA 3'-exonuclease trimmer n=1 Tax=Frankliniella fusca TaxID=407009 RepID=A0AAE1H0D9_9NEOP|nr:Pre-piRNA 3'-exonuclease trimmer [Frankliniella fusca]
MSEVLRDSFENYFPKIEKNIKDAAFISIDTEFSCLFSNNDSKSSLFDTAEQRYLKQKDNISEALLVQFGLTAFIFDRENNVYQSHSYCFYLFPHTFGSNDQRFKCQASSLEFLCHHKFDFNKMVYNGISFLNDEQDKRAEEELRDGDLLRSVERALSHEDEESVQAMCSQVALWLAGGLPEAASEKTIFLEVPKSSQSAQCIAYVTHHELRRRFISIWTIPEEGNIRVLKVSPTERAMMEKNHTHEDELQNAVLLSLRGFTRIFRLLVQSKKPIIAHNCILDLMIMHKQFYCSLPKSYQDFKNNIHSLFPIVYDTKYMSSEFRKKVTRADCWSNNTLPTLYNYFNLGRGFNLVSYSPQIKSDDYGKDGVPKFHDAGWDAYCAGYCFIRMAHFFGVHELGRVNAARPFTSTEHLALTAHLANRVNIIRGNLTHIVLDGLDPPSHRPEIIVVKRRDGKAIDALQLTESLSKHGSLDVKMVSNKLALVAASTKGQVLDLCRDYYKHPEYAVVKYNMIQHDPFIWTASLFSLVMCATLSGIFIYRFIKA